MDESRDSRGFLPAHQWVIMSLGIVCRLAIAWSPEEFLLRYVLADDSFYYFTIARNIAGGAGATFDQLAQTNGFHPLWMVFVTPVYFLTSNPTVGLHLILSIAALVDLVSMILLLRILTHFEISRALKGIVLSIYVMSPLLLSNKGIMNGLETSINVTSIFLFISFLIRIGPAAPSAHWFRLGALVGLAVLARTDNTVLFFVPVIALFVGSMRTAGLRSRIAFFAFGAIVVTAPWFFWSYLNFGMFIQTSGLSIPIFTMDLISEGGWGLTDSIVQFLRNVLLITTFFPFYVHGSSLFSVSGIVSVLLSLLMVALGIIQWRLPEFRGRLSRLFPFLPGILLFVAVHTFRAVYLRGWYFTGLIPVLLVMSAILIDSLLEGQRSFPTRARYTVGLTIVAFCSTLFSYSIANLFTSRVGEIDKFAMAGVMNKELPENTLVGSWNAGVYGYYFKKGKVVNLDGVVNNGLLPYIRARNMTEYCDSIGLQYFIDTRGAINYASRFLGEPLRADLTEGVVVAQVYGEKEEEPILLVRRRIPEKRDGTHKEEPLKGPYH